MTDQKMEYFLLGMVALLLLVCVGVAMDNDYLTQKYICPCITFSQNTSNNNYFEGYLNHSDFCSKIDLKDTNRCKTFTDTICREVSWDKLVCDKFSS